MARTRHRSRSSSLSLIRRSSIFLLKGKETILTKLVVAAVGATLLSLVALYIYINRFYPKEARQGQNREVIVYAPADLNPKSLASLLHKKEVIEQPFFFQLYLKFKGAAANLTRGPYFLRHNMTPEEVLHHLAKGYGKAYIKVTVPEGMDRFEIAEILAMRHIAPKEAFIRATSEAKLLHELGIDGESVEGFLFPDTYEFTRDSYPPQIIKTMVVNFRNKTQDLLQRDAKAIEKLRNTLAFSLRDVVTLASIVEKEAAVVEEQAVIAGVFLNRLKDPNFTPKRLQADPTVSYGCKVYVDLPACRAAQGGLTRAVLVDRHNPYNTYRHEGLPPGPIGNPGLAALQAVLEPARHNYFYFVASGEGRRHSFSRELREHVRYSDRRFKNK